MSLDKNTSFVDKFSPKHCIGRERMGLPQNGKQNKLPSRDPPLAETAACP